MAQRRDREGQQQARLAKGADLVGVPGGQRSTAELGEHDCLGFNFRRAAAVWLLKTGGRLVDREVDARIVANNGETVRHMAVLGLGLAHLAEFHIGADLAAGRLVAVLDEAMADSEEIHAVYSGRERAPHRVLAFLDFMTPRLRALLE
jgi:DNA-binding transcriptional LysR family regulator